MVAARVYSYISRDSPGAADKVVHGIYEKAHLLLALPDIGHLYEPEKHPGVRILLYGRYRIVYQRRSDENVYVLGVFHGALDLAKAGEDDGFPSQVGKVYEHGRAHGLALA